MNGYGLISKLQELRTSILYGGLWSYYRCGRFNSGYHSIGGCVTLKISLDIWRRAKKLPLPRTVYRLRYTEFFICIYRFSTGINIHMLEING